MGQDAWASPIFPRSIRLWCIPYIWPVWQIQNINKRTWIGCVGTVNERLEKIKIDTRFVYRISYAYVNSVPNVRRINGSSTWMVCVSVFLSRLPIFVTVRGRASGIHIYGVHFLFLKTTFRFCADPQLILCIVKHFKATSIDSDRIDVGAPYQATERAHQKVSIFIAHFGCNIRLVDLFAALTAFAMQHLSMVCSCRACELYCSDAHRFHSFITQSTLANIVPDDT